MTKNPDTNRFSTEDLLDLSLSVGKYPDFEKAVQFFIENLKTKLHFEYYEIWEKNQNNIALVYPIENRTNFLRSFAPSGGYIDFFKNADFSLWKLNAADLVSLNLFLDVSESDYYIIHLYNKIFFFFGQKKGHAPLNNTEIKYLSPVLSRFGIFIQHGYELQVKLDSNFLSKRLKHTTTEIDTLIVDNISEGIMICDLQGKMIYINNKLLEVSEYKLEDVLYKPISVISFEQGDLKEIGTILKQVFEENKTIEKVSPLYKPLSGAKWWAKGTISPYRNSTGTLIGAIALIRDITPEIIARKAKEALKIKQQQYDLIINQGFDGVLTFDLISGKLLNVNDAFLKNIGYSRNELLEKGLEEVSLLIQPDGQNSKEFITNINLKLRSNPHKKINYEWTHTRKDGSLYYVEVIALVFDSAGIPLKIEIHQDITQKYLAQAALQDSRLKLTKFFDRSPIAVHIRSIESHQFERVNQKFIQLFGYTLEEINQLSRDQLVLEEDDEFIQKKMELLFKKEIQSFRSEKQYIRKDGSTFWGAGTRSLVELEEETLIIGFIEDITKQKKAQSALEESEAKVRAIFNSTEDKILAIDPSFRLVYFNKAADKFIKDFYGRSYKIGEVFQAPDRPIPEKWYNFYMEALKGQSNTGRRSYVLNGEKRVDLISVLPNRDPKGVVIGITLYGRDITELEQAQTALERSKELLLEGERLGKFGNWEVDLIHKKIYWSEGTFRIFDRSKEQGQITFDEFKKYAVPEELPSVFDLFEQLKSDQKINPVEFRAITETGREIYVVFNLEQVIENGILTKVFGTCQDISTLKEAEKYILESSQKYQDLFDNMYDAFLTMDKDGRFLNANKAIERLIGYPLEELQSLKVQDIVHPADQEKSRKYLDKLITDGYYSNYQGRIITKAGKIKYVQVNSNAIIENGEMIGSRDIVRDITELKKAEQKREQLYQELAIANKELKDFAYIVSHDLKAPLRAISSLSNWIAEDYAHLFDEEGKQHINLLIGRANRMQNFIEGILKYSRLGKGKLDKEHVDINLMVREIIKDLNPPKQFNIKLEGKTPPIFAQKIRIQQVFQNLISNALKYNDKELGQIYISHQDTPTHHKFFIKDNGPGIEERHFERIFQIFQTLQARDELESTGIGLTIVKKIIELHGGEITLESELDKGSTFIFTIAK